MRWKSARGALCPAASRAPLPSTRGSQHLQRARTGPPSLAAGVPGVCRLQSALLRGMGHDITPEGRCHGALAKLCGPQFPHLSHRLWTAILLITVILLTCNRHLEVFLKEVNKWKKKERKEGELYLLPRVVVGINKIMCINPSAHNKCWCCWVLGLSVISAQGV